MILEVCDRVLFGLLKMMRTTKMKDLESLETGWRVMIN